MWKKGAGRKLGNVGKGEGEKLRKGEREQGGKGNVINGGNVSMKQTRKCEWKKLENGHRENVARGEWRNIYMWEMRQCGQTGKGERGANVARGNCKWWKGCNGERGQWWQTWK